MDESGVFSQDAHDEDDEDDYEEANRGNRLLGFMFGNVDGSGDLDVDYLDEDAKEHIAALADKLGSSLTDIDLSIKLPSTPGEASEQDYDEKAEDAVDYEDIEEQYEGPEVQAASEEDHLLPKKEFFSAEVSLASLEGKASVFDEENYDEDEEFDKGPEVVENKSAAQTTLAASEEDQLLPNKEIFSAEVSLAFLEHKASVFDEENYDEDGDFDKEPEVVKNSDAQTTLAGEQHGLLSEEDKFVDGDLPSHGSFETEIVSSVNLEDFQEEEFFISPEPFDGKRGTTLPVLCIQDGMKILRFSEIFGINEPLMKREKKEHHRYSILGDRFKTIDAPDNVEEDDEETILKASCQGVFTTKHSIIAQDDYLPAKDIDEQQVMFNEGLGMLHTQADEQRKDSCLSAQPMKEGIVVDLSAGWQSPSCHKVCPLYLQDWDKYMTCENSPSECFQSSESCLISGSESEAFTNSELEVEVDPQKLGSEFQMEPSEKGQCIFLQRYPILVEQFGSRNFSEESNLPTSTRNFHPQMLRLDSRPRMDDSHHLEESKQDVVNEEHCRGDVLRRFTKLTSQNKELADGSWLKKVRWEPSESIPRPKLILDLQDEQMLFEIPDNKDGIQLCAHAGAMIVTRSMKSSYGDSHDLSGQGLFIGRFNISNDKYYSNRKTSQQSKSHSKKRAVHGVKVMHSVPALRLQTMKPKLSNKDLANFHRPKALWYPHDNEVAAKEQGKLSTQGPMKIVIKSMGGKGSKLHVDAEETVSSVKAKASKKLDFKSSEIVKVFYSGKELEDDKSLVMQNVRPNSLLHLVRTKIHLWPKAQKLPGENKPLRPPGAFKKKSELSVKVGHVFLMEYCEERPLLLGNVGMGARLCTYYQKLAPGDQTASSLRNGSNSMGNVLTLDPADKSPFLGDIKPGCSQSSLETNMYRAPIFPHKLSSTDYLLVRSAKGKLSLRRIDKIHVVGQQEPHMEVISPGTKGLQTYIGNRLLVYIYREFRTNEKPGFLPFVRVDELSAQFPNLSEAFLRKRLKHCADLQKGSNGQLLWVMRRNFRIPSEEELRRMVTPENVCVYESMQAGLYRLKRLGISRLTNPAGLSSAMNQLPDEAIALAAAAHIERELQITPWNLSSNFVACTSQDRENIERLEITGVGDPSGRGLGFSYVRVAPKAPVSSAVLKKKVTATKGGTTVTGTDADLRRLSMDAAREVLLKFNVPEEQIEKMTRWHRIAMVRKLSSEQAASGVKVDATPLSKFARGQRMSFLQLQQQTREKCQEIWDRQVQSLSAADGDENESDSEANSDLDSFAGDLENLLDAEECEGEDEDGSDESKRDKVDGVRGLKMRRRPSQAQAEEEIEDEAAEAAELCRILMDDDEAEGKKKKKAKVVGKEKVGLTFKTGFGSENTEFTKKPKTIVKKVIRVPQPDGSFISKEIIIRDPKEVESLLARRNLAGKVKAKKGNGKNEMRLGLLKKKSVAGGTKLIKDKKPTEKGVRDSFVCGACGQLGHMRTNKNCPKYGEDLEIQVESKETDKTAGKPNLDASTQLQPKLPIKKLVPKAATKLALVETAESAEKLGSKLTAKFLPLKIKCGPSDKLHEKNMQGPQSSGKEISADTESRTKSLGKVNKIIISNKTKSEQGLIEPPKPSIVIRPPVPIDRDQPRKKIIIKQPKGMTDVEQVKQTVGSGVDDDFRKTKKIIELSSFEVRGKQENKYFAEEVAKRKAIEDGRLWEEEEKRRSKERRREERVRWVFNGERQTQEEQHSMSEMRCEEKMNRKREERQKAKKKTKNKKPEFRDEYFEEQRTYRNDRRIPDRDRAAKRRPVTDLGWDVAEYAPQTKRRKGGEVELSNILVSIVDCLKKQNMSYLFLKPVTKKEAPDYLDIIERPMDLSTIRERARRMEYKNSDDFRHDVWQITWNAHLYNDGRNPGIPPLADQLLEICDYMLTENGEKLADAESGIEFRDV